MSEHVLGFAGSTIDRVAARRTDKAWLAERLADPATRMIRFIADRPRIRISDSGGAQIACEAPGTARLMKGVDPVLLGLDAEGRAVFAVLDAEEAAAEADAAVKLLDLRSLAMQGLLPPADLGLLAQARTLLHWHSRHRFCANCGSETTSADGGYRRSCAACRAEHFPRTDPVAIMVVVDGDRCLLGRQPNFAPGMYSALAGFVEPGESIEEAARREVFEEAGVRVGGVRYHSSQPWPFPANLMIGLIGEAVTSAIAIDPGELEDARWFGRDEIRAMLAGSHPQGLKVPAPMAIAWHLISAAYSS